MRTILGACAALVLLVSLFSGLIACGQKGDLTLPKAPAVPKAAPALPVSPAASAPQR